MDPDRYLEALLTLPRLVNPLPSPDGRWVAWTSFGAGAGADVYAAPTDASSSPVRLTDTPERTVAVSWMPDSRALIVTQDHDGDERNSLYRVDLEHPGVMVQLTEPSPPYFLRGGQLHPNGRWLVYAANYDFVQGRETEQTAIYRHDLQTGERLQLARPEKGSYLVPRLNAPGTHVLYTRKDRDPSGQQIWMVDIEGKNDREILNFGPTIKVEASWFPDGRRVIFRAEADGYMRLGLWDRETGDSTWLIDDPARNIEGAYVPFGSNQAVVIEVLGAGVRASLLDTTTGQETRLPNVDGNLTPLAPVAGKSGEWVGIYYSSVQPATLVRFSPGDVNLDRFVSLDRVWDETSLRPGDFARAEDFHWKSVDGVEIQGWLYRARGQARGTIVYVHGGPTSHSEDKINPEIQYYVSQGFNVLDPNYRGSTGFGLRFRNAIKEDGWGGREQDDIRTGIEALITEGVAEPGKVGVTGTSYGGYSSWCAVTRWPIDVLAASVPICGMTDLVVDYQTTRPDLRPYSEEMIGGRPDEVPERYRERSPINFVQNIKGRLLIVQGMQDPNVSPENVRAVEEALSTAGVPYEVLAFPDEGHGIYRPKNRAVLYPRLVDFFSQAFDTAH